MKYPHLDQRKSSCRRRTMDSPESTRHASRSGAGISVQQQKRLVFNLLMEARTLQLIRTKSRITYAAQVQGQQLYETVRIGPLVFELRS